MHAGKHLFLQNLRPLQAEDCGATKVLWDFVCFHLGVAQVRVPRRPLPGGGLVASTEPASLGRGGQQWLGRAEGHLLAPASGRRLQPHILAVDEDHGGRQRGRLLPAGRRLLGGPSGVGWFLTGFGGGILHSLPDKQLRTVPVQN